jgi:ubiquinone/menaquinone biosynthesis C-methylase UbiE
VHAPFARKIVGYLPASQPNPTIVDLGCGSGQLAVELGKLRPEARILGVDPSAEMLRIAAQNVAKAGLSGVEIRPGSAEELPLESGSVDLLVSQSSFHEWTDPQQGLAEIYRVLRPGGQLILKDYNLAWLSPWKRKLLGALHPLHMFKFTFDQAQSLLAEARFDLIDGQGNGLHWFVRATRPGEAQGPAGSFPASREEEPSHAQTHLPGR